MVRKHKSLWKYTFIGAIAMAFIVGTIMTIVNMHSHSNKLKDSASPYLLQHARNPVDWYPWGEEALTRARKENKPILLSIGYSTCYWCHVMEREVFENETIAQMMNEHFINIKVDREERPDLDDIYMTATQILTRHGGWPNNVFLTPELKPFYAGTYFPAEDSRGRAGFPSVLTMLHQSWLHKRPDIERTATEVTTRLQKLLSVRSMSADKELSEDTIHDLANAIQRNYDARWGGFFQAPKFPHEAFMLFLLDYYRIYDDQEALNVALGSLDKMAAGGIYDHVGGGFHRYSVDEKWHVPHFEKMLYNQGLMAQAYISAYEITRNPYYESIARSILDFVSEYMTGTQGQFYSAMDAETDEAEGAYYVWGKEDLESILSPGALTFFYEMFSLADVPHFPGHKHPEGSVIYAKAPLDLIAARRGHTYDDLQGQLDKIFGKLLLKRQNRELPFVDTKVIASWNGMMITAFARAGEVLGDARYIEKAKDAAQFVLQNMVNKKGILARIWHQEKMPVRAFLDDYVYVIQSLLAISRATGEKDWIQHAIDLINKADDLYYDDLYKEEGKGGFFFSQGARDLLVRIKSADDSAIPSANAVMVQVLVDMAELTKGTQWEHPVWQERASETINAFAMQMVATPMDYVSIFHGMMRLNKIGEGWKAPSAEIISFNNDNAEETMGSKTISSEHYVKVTTALEQEQLKPGQTTILNVTLKIAEDWHININPAPLNFLIPTSVDVRGKEIDLLRVDYPPATGFSSQFPDGTIDVYSDEITIPVSFGIKKWVQAGDIVSMHVHVAFQVCSNTTCLQPANLVIDLPIIMASK